MIDWDRIDNLDRLDLVDLAYEVGDVVQSNLSRIKLGLYREEHDGDLLTVLEEIERILR